LKALVDYIYADHLDTPRVIVRSGDHVPIWRWDNSADPFGAVPPSDNPSGLGVYIFNLRMPGQVFDSESGMYYNMHRDYVAGWGRYAQSDPIGLEGGNNTYTYAEGNPVSYTDPTGEFVPQLIGFGIGAGLEYLTNPCASATDILLAGGLGALGGGLSKAVFLRLGPRSLTRETGLEWSHSIARSTVNRHTSGGVNRVLNQRGGLNGSWRTPASHARHDASRHVPGVDPMPLPLRALDRIPDWLKGTGLGGGVGAAVAGGDCECRR
jgi:RHS repeat-associated protein